MGCFDEEGERMSQKGFAVAPSNIALVKYWGKRDIRRNLPAMGSLSVSLKGLETRTTVEFLDEPGEDEVWVDGSPVGEAGVKRVNGMLSIVREATGVVGRAEIRSETSFPVGAGIASSASGMAAVVLAASSAAGWDVSLEELSCVARLGSSLAPLIDHASTGAHSVSDMLLQAARGMCGAGDWCWACASLAGL